MNPFQKTHFGKGLKSKKRLLRAVPMKIHWHLGSYNPFCFPQTNLLIKIWQSLSASILDCTDLKVRKNKGVDSAECPRSSDFHYGLLHPPG